MSLKEEIIQILKESFNSVYCDTCTCNNNYDEDTCDYCHRKSMYWEISDDYAERVANRIIEKNKGD